MIPANLSRKERGAYQKLYGKVPIGAAIVTEHGLVVWLNQLAKQFLGIVQAGKVLLPNKDWPRFRDSLDRGEPFYFTVSEQGFIFTPQPLPHKEKRLLLWIVPSNSMELDLFTMQKDLIQQRRLANLGKLMLEMAHELNNPLAGISMGTQLIRMSMDKLTLALADRTDVPPLVSQAMEKIHGELERINQCTNRAAGLREELLSYSKPSILNLKAYKMCDLMETIVSHLRQQPLFMDMQFETSFSEVSPSILCDLSKIEQIVYNLVKNTLDATDGKGCVWIREFVQGPHVRLEFEDNGPGIPEDMLGRIFSPFLTTKPRTGTGLGLSISQQIIHQHGGTITVYNKPESGACFQITLPILHDELSN